MRPSFKLLAGTVGLSLYSLKLLWPRLQNWGSTAAEVQAALPGDEVVERPYLQTTRSISIAAPPPDVWKWIVQMGPRPRAGVYTYDWIQRMLGIDIENSNRILPEFQHMQVGEGFALNGKTKLIARRVEPDSCLVLQWDPGDTSWAFVLKPDASGTRLTSRTRIPKLPNALAAASMKWFMTPGSLVMERKMLLGIKKRAEKATLGN